MARIDSGTLTLYLVTDRKLAGGRKITDIVEAAVRGGVTMVQLREKDLSTREFVSEALELKKLLSPLGVPLIINDRLDVALSCDADGVHIGQSDMPVDIARKILGPGKIIGLSVESVEDALRSNELDIDYIGISPVFSTATKSDTAPALGLDGVRAITSVSRFPAVGIGGMNVGTACDVIAAGADGIAVVSAIVAADDPCAAAGELLSVMGKRARSNVASSRMGEFELIEYIRSRFPLPEGVKGIGDDCAVMPQRDGVETLVSSDLLLEGVHFLRPQMSSVDLGYKSVTVNVSDIAGMGGKPTGIFLSLAIPATVSDDYLYGFIDGFARACDEYGITLLGGDTTSSKSDLCISVTVVGEAPEGRSVKRSGARVGDLICVTGCLGDSAAGLKVLLDGNGRDLTKEETELLSRHFRPSARVREGLVLSNCPGVHSMMDISDGLGSDLRHILDESGVGAVIRVADVPLSQELQSFCASQGLDPLDLALDGGEDYELLFTVAPECVPELDCAVIGEIVDGSAVEWKGSSKDFKGYRHF